MDGLPEKSIGAERRGFYRFELPQGKLAVEVGTGVVSATEASVQNISRGGVLVALKEAPTDGIGVGHCVVRFLSEKSRVQPATARGTILRRGLGGTVVQVAIEFAEPLEALGLVDNGGAAPA